MTAVICTAAGAAFSAALERRCAVLRDIAAIIEGMRVKIRYRSVRMSELISEAASEARFARCGFIHTVSEKMHGGMSVNEAWCEAASRALFITEADRDILKGIGADLGCSDTDGQLSLLALGASMIEKAIDEAERERTAKSRMILSVWTLCGIGAGILLI